MAQYTQDRKVPTVQEFRQIEKEREQASLQNGSELAASEQAEAAPSIAVPDRDGSLRQRKNAGPAAGEDGDDDDDEPVSGDEDFGEKSGQAEKERLKQQSMPQGKPTDFKEKGKR